MYRYQKMMNQFLKLDEYEGYRMDMTILKSIYFRKITKKGTYVIKILDGAYYDAVIFKQRKEDKHYERIPYEKAEKSVRQLTEQINCIIKKANQYYEVILPFFEHVIGETTFTVSSFSEEMPRYKDFPISYPTCITVWMDIYKEKEKIGEIQLLVRHKMTKKEQVKWEVETKKIVYQHDECRYKDVETLKILLLEVLNKPHRLRHLF